ncbi:hypothetical protein HZH66_007919 [Vespula vulgaris]|uniref:Uncharacterized protein n=1 Tax=Vespula vulgaris TaxID=7454 RepID=A0A834N3T0_VESVU|nr:hypothetical protein HZH66_007919 [Vespula vulgaris]
MEFSMAMQQRAKTRDVGDRGERGERGGGGEGGGGGGSGVMGAEVRWVTKKASKCAGYSHPYVLVDIQQVTDTDVARTISYVLCPARVEVGCSRG